MTSLKYTVRGALGKYEYQVSLFYLETHDLFDSVRLRADSERDSLAIARDYFENYYDANLYENAAVYYYAEFIGP